MDDKHLMPPPVQLSEARSGHRHREPEVKDWHVRNPDGSLMKVTKFGNTNLDKLHYKTVFGEDKKHRRHHYHPEEVPTGSISENGSLTLDKFRFDDLFGGRKSPRQGQSPVPSPSPEPPRPFTSNVPYYGTPEILSTLTSSRKLGEATKIWPISDGKAWINTVGDNFLTLIDKTGKRIKRSPSYDNCIWDFTLNKKHKMFLTVDHSSLVHALTAHGEKNAAGNFLGYQPYGICVTDDGRLLVCMRPLAGTAGHSKLVMIATNGEIMREISERHDGTPLFTDPYNVLTTSSGKIFIRDGNTKVVCLNVKGKHLYTWKNHGDDDDEIFNPSRLTSDSHGSLIVSSKDANKVYILPVDGKGLRCLLDSTHGMDGPWGMGVDGDGHLWISCKDRKIHIIKYEMEING